MNKPVSEASERNKQPILDVIQPLFHDCDEILEIGTGTGQHAVFFGAALPDSVWRTSDLSENHDGILEWLRDCGTENVLPPLELDVDELPWPIKRVGGVFSANTAHIMAWPSVVNMFFGVGQALDTGGVFCLYGPFNYNHEYTSQSNAEFDAWLKSVALHQGIRDFEEICTLAKLHGMQLESDITMPANNRTLVFRKMTGVQEQ